MLWESLEQLGRDNPELLLMALPTAVAEIRELTINARPRHLPASSSSSTFSSRSEHFNPVEYPWVSWGLRSLMIPPNELFESITLFLEPELEPEVEKWIPYVTTLNCNHQHLPDEWLAQLSNSLEYLYYLPMEQVLQLPPTNLSKLSLRLDPDLIQQVAHLPPARTLYLQLNDLFELNQVMQQLGRMEHPPYQIRILLSGIHPFDPFPVDLMLPESFSFSVWNSDHYEIGDPIVTYQKEAFQRCDLLIEQRLFSMQYQQFRDLPIVAPPVV